MLRDSGREPITAAQLVATLGVTDIARSAAFYARVIGLRITSYTETSATLAEPWRSRDVLRLVAVPTLFGSSIAGRRLRRLVFGFGADADITQAVVQIRRAGADIRSHFTFPRWSELRLDDPDGHPISMALDVGFERRLRSGPVRRAFGDTSLSGPIRIAAVHLDTADVDAAAAFWAVTTGAKIERRDTSAVIPLRGGGPGIVVRNQAAPVAAPLDLLALDVAVGPTRTSVGPDGLRVGLPRLATTDLALGA